MRVYSWPESGTLERAVDTPLGRSRQASTPSGKLPVWTGAFAFAVDRNPAKLSGGWCFRGTRLPVASLFEHLDRGSTVEEFLKWFPAVNQEQVHEVIAFTKS